ncbi:LAME_0C07404g1_1 [Lachancea meyersii CBS 8951]|uniref:Vacuolar fusion protein MON1 n=1 Tax=Lachancea meyersii CBS 8951 TaxID=1266667 RepID=A0A1G4J2L0_9SACH|nr:LAME_0C07404g1_1 [Lachancea meyersii CBS 8951]
MAEPPLEDYVDEFQVRDKPVSRLDSRPASPFAVRATNPTTSVNFTSSFSTSSQPFLGESRPSSSSMYLDLASERQSVRTNHRDLEHELLQSMRSLDLTPRDHAVSNEIPSLFECIHSSSAPVAALRQEKQFFILSSAGKPVFSMHGQDELVMGLMGIIHTVTNYFKVHATKVRAIVNSCGNSVKQKLVFLDKSPILLMAVSLREESVNDLLQQLDFLYSYLICTLSRRQLTRLFSRRENFDLRHFLTNTDFQNLTHICESIANGFNPDFLLGALRCLTMRKSTRQALHGVMLTHVQHPDAAAERGTILYGLIVAPGGQLCSVLRPKGHTLHTTDLHLLFSLIFNQFQGLQQDQELWLPICFPKFNSSGFLHCYIRLLSDDKSRNVVASQNTSSGSDARSSLSEYASEENPSNFSPKPALVLISAQKESFFALKKIGQGIVDDLISKHLLEQITAISSLGFTMADIPAKFVHHFIYKSKKHVQYVMPRLEELDLYNNDTYDDANSTFTANERSEGRESLNAEDGMETDKKGRHKHYLYKLMRTYTHIRNNVIDENGVPFNKSVLSFVQWLSDGLPMNDLPQGEAVDVLCLAWLTPNFELLLICNNGASDRNVILKSAKSIVDWCRKNEDRLFVKNGAIF